MQDWAAVATVRDPFRQGWISGTFSLRPDWSPDGSLLAAVNSFQSPCHTVALLERGAWAFDFSMVGHRGGPSWRTVTWNVPHCGGACAWPAASGATGSLKHKG